jgi:hypothetical protein
MRLHLLIVLLGVGCVVDGSLGKDERGGGTGDGSSTGDATETSSSDSSTGSTTAATETGASSTGDAFVCEPSAKDPACMICIEAHCCEALESCVNAGACDCILDCMMQGDSATVCINHCGEASDETMALHACEQEQCAIPCPG